MEGGRRARDARLKDRVRARDEYVGLGMQDVGLGVG